MFRIGDGGLARRGIESCGLAFLLCLLLAPGALAQGSKVHRLQVRQTASQSLTLIRPSDPLFEGMLDTYFPGLSDEPAYQGSIRPFLVIVRNDTALPAVAYAITWTMQYATYPVRRRWSAFVNGLLMNRGVNTFLRPGDIRLIAPMFNLAPEGYRHFHSFGKMFPASHFPPSQGLVSVDENVDGVVYGGGSFIGADKTEILQRYVMARFAARDEVLAALKLTQSPTVPQAIVFQPLAQMLHQQVQWGLADNQDTLMGLYIRARERSALSLETILRNQGVSGLEKFLARFTPSGANTNPSAFGRWYQKLSANNPKVLESIPPKAGGPSLPPRD